MIEETLTGSSDEFFEIMGNFEIDTEEEATIFLASICYAAVQLSAKENGDTLVPPSMLIVSAGIGAIMQGELWDKYGGRILTAIDDIMDVFGGES